MGNFPLTILKISFKEENATALHLKDTVVGFKAKNLH